ncbi:YitT family protein [Clostridium sp. D2Q-14]|uniref:YitT family protein n=1 Tax=Anaeromonas gelatinilytica TaxID=2683194 RepID=UPI00193C42DA|nr:YitT family protein [Anaeromonas gelatinilytica]MBS4536341.1 YitT family protein [Anaeromonas gelatinilytica]
MVKKKWYNYIIDYVAITVGTMVMAIALNMFLEPNTIAPGGISGFAIVIEKVTDGFLKMEIVNLMINILLFTIGVIILGKTFGIKTLYAILGLFFFIRIISNTVATNNLLLSSIFGGLLLGIGVGIIFKFGGTTGGTDLAGAILHKYFPSISTSKLMMAVDFMVVIFAGLVDKKIDTALYSLIALYISVKAIDQIMSGFSYSKAFLIISERPKEIGTAILSEIGRGATILKGKGMYTELERDTLLCVVNRVQIVKLKDLIHRLDPNAFVMITDIHEVLGNGFKNINSN